MKDDRLISFNAAIDALHTWFRDGFDEDKWWNSTHVLAAIEGLPPAEQWIPCSERMPEEHEWIGTKKFGTTISNEVYVTFETPDGERFAKHISFQNGKLSSVDEQHMKVWYKGAKPIAWMPNPEPWKGKQNG